MRPSALLLAAASLAQGVVVVRGLGAFPEPEPCPTYDGRIDFTNFDNNSFDMSEIGTDGRIDGDVVRTKELCGKRKSTFTPGDDYFNCKWGTSASPDSLKPQDMWRYDSAECGNKGYNERLVRVFDADTRQPLYYSWRHYGEPKCLTGGPDDVVEQGVLETSEAIADTDSGDVSKKWQVLKSMKEFNTITILNPEPVVVPHPEDPDLEIHCVPLDGYVYKGPNTNRKMINFAQFEVASVGDTYF